MKYAAVVLLAVLLVGVLLLRSPELFILRVTETKYILQISTTLYVIKGQTLLQ